MDDFLESKLLEILIMHSNQPFAIPINPTPGNSTEQLKAQVRGLPKDTAIYLTDKFTTEYLDRVATGMNQRQLEFYDKLFSKLLKWTQ